MFLLSGRLEVLEELRSTSIRLRLKPLNALRASAATPFSRNGLMSIPVDKLSFDGEFNLSSLDDKSRARTSKAPLL
ncbi:hypothetical protein [Mesorhizobium sp. M0323]|uniref:hypothetical protein n=1 Tax=Mesorhizobium sp. M0323 TaxID=2956938 RepID=UPI00333CB3B1